MTSFCIQVVSWVHGKLWLRFKNAAVRLGVCYVSWCHSPLWTLAFNLNPYRFVYE